MVFSNDSEELIRFFIDSIDTKNKTHPFIKELYKKFRDVEKNKITNTQYKCNRNIRLISSESDIPKISLMTSNYTPKKIVDYIYSRFKIDKACSNVYEYNYKIEYLQKKMNIYFFSFENETMEQIDSYVHLMLYWLLTISEYATKICSETITIYIFLTPLKKVLPDNEILNVEHINSAVTTECIKNGEILIYRKEEWLKVFIHETMHVYGLDFSSMVITKFKEHIQKLFPIESEFRIYEGYSEFFATIIHCALISYNIIEDKQNETSFLNTFIFCLQLEIRFSFFQCNKILSFMGLKYNHLYDNKKLVLYKEKTNTFSYFIIKTIFLFNYVDFLNWCKKNNSNIIKFKENQKKLLSLFQFIKQKYNNPAFIKMLNKKNCKKKTALVSNTMRMTICELM